jgi:CRISPR system Cascade subunit CasD
LPKHDLNTILSTRDYRQDAASLVAVQDRDGAPHALSELAQALAKPRFTLYLGRKACPPALPLNPQVIVAKNALLALQAYQQALVDRGGGPALALERMVWGEGIELGTAYDIEFVRKDRVLSRKHWQFGDRVEYVALKPQVEQ